MRWAQTLLAAVVAILVAALVLAALHDNGAAEERAGEALLTAVVPPTAERPPGPARLEQAIGGEIEAAPGAVAVVPDPQGGEEPVFALRVDEEDVYPVTPTENPRAQILTEPVIEPGDEIWLATSFLIPREFPPIRGWLSLISIYGPPFEGSSPWQIGVERDLIRWERNAAHAYDVPWQMRLTRGHWIDVLLHQRFAEDGWVEMWIDGERVTFFASRSYNPNGEAPTQRLEMATVDASNDGGANHAKIMQYREAGALESATVYFGALKVGATRQAVE